MAVYLGNAGLVSIQRTGASSYNSTLDPADVNVAQKRFSFDFPNDTFITGDYLQITRTGGGNLDFVDASGFTPPGVTSTGAWYVNVDAAGGIRLFKTWGEALKGDVADAVILATPSGSYAISATLTSGGFRTLGEVTAYELSTQRVALDATVLGEEFVNQVSGLVSGSGQITCFWDFGENGDFEAAQYIHHLVLRQQLGSNFSAALTLKRGGESAATGPNDTDSTQLYYLIDGVITNVGVSFEAGNAVQSQIEFVTTGQIQLRYSTTDTVAGSLLLQENSSALDLESGIGRLLQDEL
jgi:hypothetical protein